MLTTLWIILLIVAIILILVIADLDYHDYPIYWVAMLSILDTIVWFLLAASVFELEEPWSSFNATSGFVEHGITIVTSKVSPEVMYFCLMMAACMMLYDTYAILTLFRELYDEYTGKPKHPYEDVEKMRYH